MFALINQPFTGAGQNKTNLSKATETTLTENKIQKMNEDNKLLLLSVSETFALTTAFHSSLNKQ